MTNNLPAQSPTSGLSLNEADQTKPRVASAPGRINLIGEHTDYNLGFTLPMAIDRYTTATAELVNDNDSLTFLTNKFSESVVYSLDGLRCLSHEPAPLWSKYPAGVVHQLTELGFQFPALKIQIESNVPLGAGVSSSASIEVAIALVLQKIADRYLSSQETALVCQMAEHQHVGVPCGLMDQLASISGIADHLMLLDCRSNTIEQIPFSPELAVVVVNSHVKHRLADGEYRQRREQCQTACRILGVSSLRDVTIDVLKSHQSKMPELIFRRARHVVTENSRTVEAASRLLSGQWQAVGELMYLSHESMRDDFEISTSEIDSLVEIARSLADHYGILGSRMTGGGFGGCTVTLALAQHADEILEKIVEKYRKMTGIAIDGFVSRPANGAFAIHRQNG